MLYFVENWRVRTDLTISDHNAVETILRPPKTVAAERRVGGKRFDTRRVEWDRYAECLAVQSRSRLEAFELYSAEGVEIMADALACDASMLRKRLFTRSKPWWTKELTKQKKTVYRQRCELQREREEPRRQLKKLEYRLSLRGYSRAVQRKLESWQHFVTSHRNSELWVIVYKLQAKKFRVTSMLSTLRRSSEDSTKDARKIASLLLKIHVPDDREDHDIPEAR